METNSYRCPLLIFTLLLLLHTTSTTAQDCSPIPTSGSEPIDGAISIIKDGNFYNLFETWAAPAAGLDVTSFSAVDALSAAGVIVGVIVDLLSGTAVYNNAAGGCWNVEGNYGLPGGRMINYGCDWGLFTTENFKFGATSPDGEGWSQIGAEPCGIAYCLYAGSTQGDPLFTANCDDSGSDDTQKFMFLPVGGSNFLFIHKATSQCLYLASDGIRTTTCNTDDETQLFQWCNHVSQSCVVPSGPIFNPC